MSVAEAALPMSAPPVRPGGVIPNAVVGMLAFLATETMFFAGLMSAFMILKAGSIVWPPPNQPRLPAPVTAINTLLLLFSGFTVARSSGALKRSSESAAQWLRYTATLGFVFLLIQGSEWVRLIQHGLTSNGGNYAGVFYTLIGTHALHVLGGVLFLATVARNARRGRYSATQAGVVSAAQLYWYFIIFVWLVLYVVVYQ